MKYIKWVVLSMILISISKSHSQEPGGYGWNCFHNGTFYAMVGGNMACPNPGPSPNSSGASPKHDPNDHNCVITRFAASNH